MSDGTSSLFGYALRRPPANIEAEAALLGGLLANNSAFDRVGGFLRAEHFADELNGKLYAAIEKRIHAGQLADAVTLQGEFDRAYLADLLTSMVAPLLCSDYARAVVDCALRRQLCEMAQQVDAAARGDDDSGCGAIDLIAAMQDRLAALADDAEPSTSLRGPRPIGEAVRAAVHRSEARHKGEQPPGLSTGLPAVDTAFGMFLQPATLTYLAGLGEVGKTTLALQVAENVARDTRTQWMAQQDGRCPGVLFFSGDMTDEQIGFRTAPRLAGVPGRKLRAGQLDDAVCMALARAQDEADALPLEIDDNPALSLAYVVQTTRRVLRRRPLALVVVDNLSKLIGEGKPGDALFPAFLNATNALKKQAMKTGVPHLLLLHLPQTVAKRDNPMPRRGDLPFGIHLHADFAFGLWRPELALSAAPPEQGRLKEEFWMKLVDQWHKRKAALKGVAEMVPLKLREDDGDGGSVVRLIFDQATGSFRDPSFRDIPPANLWDHGHA